MTPPVAVVDTNVIVAGLVTADPQAPTARLLDGMLEGRFPFLLSPALLAEYREVLRRPRLRSRHGVSDDELEQLLTEITLQAMVVERPAPGPPAPDPGDQHLWDLLAARPGAVLVTGENALLTDADRRFASQTPREYLDTLAAPGSAG